MCQDWQTYDRGQDGMGHREHQDDLCLGQVGIARLACHSGSQTTCANALANFGASL